MGKRGLWIVLLALVAGTAVAQVPRTINYQGRVRDAAGFITGQRSVTLRIYSTATGGSPLFSETQAVDFNNGVYTVVIGGGTPGGIPPAVDFSESYWLGVTIQGINNGVEMPQRLRFHSSASSIRAAVADSALAAATAAVAESAERADTADFADSTGRAGRADRADVAGGIDLPASLIFEGTDGKAVLEVVSVEQKTGVGLKATGDAYAIVSAGVDSTSRHFVAGSDSDPTAAPASGAIYRDNAPIAWGLIEAGGSLTADFGIARVSHQAGTPGLYEITLDNAVEELPVAKSLALSVMVTLDGGNEGESMLIPSWTFKQGASGLDTKTFRVLIRNVEGVRQDRRFSVVVFGRPQ